MRHRLRKSIIALPVLLALAVPAVAADRQGQESPSEMMTDAMSKMVRALELMIQSIPQYEKPEITENGDIIIRRKHPKTGSDNKGQDGPDKGKTI